MIDLRIGYIPLTDAALPIIARDKGFAAKRGLRLELARESSWANIRDRLVLGYFDAAHMLAPAAIATTLGGAHLQSPLVAPVALGLNGNALTVSLKLHEELKAASDGDMSDPSVTARALARIVESRRAVDMPPLTFGFVFPFSSHHYQLRLWMRAGGLDPDRDARLVVLPPPLMTKGLESGFLDGFCVGAPWNSLAVAQGIGSILHFGVEVVRDCPEKVLALRADWASAHVDETNALAGSILDASRWCSDPANLDEMAALVSQECGSPVTAAITRSILSGALTIEPGGTTRENKDYFRYDPDAIIPRASDASWLYRQMVDGGQLVDTAANADAARAVYRNSATPATPREPKPFL